MPTRNPHTTKIGTALGGIWRPRACMAAAQSAAKTLPLVTYSKMLMMIPATIPPASTRPQLILAMVASSLPAKVANRMRFRRLAKDGNPRVNDPVLEPVREKPVAGTPSSNYRIDPDRIKDTVAE